VWAIPTIPVGEYIVVLIDKNSTYNDKPIYTKDLADI
jgi:hypothetical protein